MKFSRRSFICASTALMAMPACQTMTASKRSIDKVGLQTYTLREIFETDTLGTLNMIKDVGYDYVELNDRNFDARPVQELADLIKNAGLYAPSSHRGYQAVRDEPQRVAAECNAVGCKYAIVPWMDDGMRSLSDWKTHAKVLNTSGKILSEEGLQMAYHNHQFEFDDLGGGTTAMDILLTETDPDLVCFELDIFWAALVAVDIPALFANYPGRFKLCHVKDLKGDPKPYATSRDYDEIKKNLMVNVGEGQIDFEAIFKHNSVSGMEYFIAEHDTPAKPFRDAITTSHDTIRNMQF